MRKLLLVMAVVGLSFAAMSMAQALSLGSGTVVAGLNTGYGWWGRLVTTATINAQSLPGVVVSGKITDLDPDGLVWVEIGLIPKATYDYWQTAYGGAYKYAVYDKGIQVVNWSSNGQGLSLQENGGSAKGGKDGGYAWPLSEPTSGSPWSFAVRMSPGGSTGGTASLYVEGATIYPKEGNLQLSYQGDYSQAYLIAQIWTNTQNGKFSFTDVKAETVPEPMSVFLGVMGLGSVAGLRRFRRK